MESLYTKYRPQTFEQVVGQKHVVETLKRAVLEGKVSHAYLFCGPRGTGKTTMARLLAKALLCRKAPGQLPDGTCEECRFIAAGTHPDVVEIDAASNTGVDNVREEIISRANYAPVRGKGKVYIIDEVHMLTTAAFNALLKTLEEPPAHVTFVLCTTDPQKVLGTVLSRVQRFDFHAIGNEDMLEHLQYVCEAEGFRFDVRALELIVRHARGGMRDALTSLEQLSVFGDGEVSLAIAQDFLGEASGSLLAHVSMAIAKRDVATLFDQVNTLVNAGRDVLQFTRELAAHVRNAYVMAAVGVDAAALTVTDDERAQLAQEVSAYGSVDRLARVLTILGDASSQMRTASNQRLVLEIACTRLARPEVDLTLESLAERVADVERKLEKAAASGSVPAPMSAPVPASAHTPALTTVSTPKSAPVSEPASIPAPAPAPTTASTPKSASAPTSVPTATPAPQPISEPASATPRPSANDEATLTRTWKEIIKQYIAKAPAHGALLQGSTLASDDGSHLLVLLPKGSEFATAMLEREEIKRELLALIEQTLGTRSIAYGESSLQNKAIADAQRNFASPPSGELPRSSMELAAPVPSPVQASGLSLRAASNSVQETAPKEGSSEFPLPWDEVSAAPASQSTPATAPSVPAVVQSVSMTAPQSVPTATQAPATPMTEPAPAKEIKPTAKASNPGPTPVQPEVSEVAGELTVSERSAETASSFGSSTETPSGDKHMSSSEIAERSALPKDLSSVASMLEEVFGPAVSVSFESNDEVSANDKEN